MRVTDCEYRPGTPEHNAWIRNVYMPWQNADPDWNARADEDHVAAQALWDSMYTDQQRQADTVMAEVQEATRPPSYLQGIIPMSSELGADLSAMAWLNPSTWKVATTDLQAAFDRMNAKLADANTTFLASLDALNAMSVPASRHAKGRRRRPPHGREGTCRHGNPSNACRNCSMGRR